MDVDGREERPINLSGGQKLLESAGYIPMSEEDDDDDHTGPETNDLFNTGYHSASTEEEEDSEDVQHGYYDSEEGDLKSWSEQPILKKK